ncbi:MAG: hypothetical protein J1F31_06625 [Erysipelotrichales bacterium]|nr:hypothetical protein [Erysipelotrichales bacterium]
MKILYTGFKGKYNASYQLVEAISPNNKILLTNSFKGIKRDLENSPLESYELILMFGINKNLKDRIVIEVNSSYDGISLSTNVNYKKLELLINKKGVNADINFKPTKYLCNYAYHNILLKNKNAIFIHIPGFTKIKDFDKFVDIFKEI